MTELRVRVLVVDDQRIVREGLTTLLGLLGTLEVVGAAADGITALELVDELDPDVVLMDLNMPRLDGIEATRALTERHPHVPVVVLTTYSDDERLLAALRAGARGFLTKDAGAAEIEAAVLAAAGGQAALTPEVQLRLLDALRSGAHAGVPQESGATLTSPGSAAILQGLTPRERDIVGLIAQGLSNGEIAERLFVSTATVKTHVNHIFAKTGVRHRAQLVAQALRAERS
ncbi:response regulator transcription factor [Terrabacter sp. NPDC080008]|uniref:response regulator transcription factor n=1 Tax=Terrabacter sp. NPDC080008 TaxID=3155176 RepID=UPI0034501E26